MSQSGEKPEGEIETARVFGIVSILFMILAGQGKSRSFQAPKNPLNVPVHLSHRTQDDTSNKIRAPSKVWVIVPFKLYTLKKKKLKGRVPNRRDEERRERATN